MVMQREIMDGARPSAKRGAVHAGLGVRLGVALALCCSLASCTATGANEVPAHVREIEALNRHLEQQFRASNLLGVADVYADDGVLLDARGERTAGREEIDAYWSAIENPVDWRIEIKKIRGSEVIAYEVGTSYLTTRHEGALVTAISDFLLLWRRAPEGSWHIELDAAWPRETR
jgi:uncharacterized protein (TIGR02246 family)